MFKFLILLCIAHQLWMTPAHSTPASTPESELKVGLFTEDPKGIVNLKYADTWARLLHFQISDPLIYIDKDGQVQPALATSWEQVSPTLWKLHLRQGVFFHNGEPFNAQSVVFSFTEYSKGDFFKSATKFGNLSRIEIAPNDPFAILLYLKKPSQATLRSLNYLIALPPKAFQKMGDAAFELNPIGTGPFRFVKHEKGQYLLYRKSPDYWDPARPKVDRLKFVILGKQDPVKALADGQIDIHLALDGRYTLRAKEAGLNVQKRLVLLSNVADPNKDSVPLKNKNVRLALNYAINRDELVKYLDHGNAIPLASMAAEGTFGRNPKLTPYPFDPDRARKLLAQTPYAKGLTLRVVTFENTKTFCNILKQHFAVIGVTLKVELIQGGTFRPECETCDLVAFRYGNSQTDFSHAASLFLEAVDDPVFRQKLEAALASSSIQAYEKALQDLDQYAHDEAITLFTTQRIMTVAARKGVKFQIPLSGSYNTSGLMSEMEVP